MRKLKTPGLTVLSTVSEAVLHVIKYHIYKTILNIIERE